jgi:hypothetical protein
MIVVIDDGFKFWVYKVWLIKVSKHFASLLSSGAEGLRASDPLQSERDAQEKSNA